MKTFQVFTWWSHNQVQKTCDECVLKQTLAFLDVQRCSSKDVQLGRDVLLTTLKKHQVTRCIVGGELSGGGEMCASFWEALNLQTDKRIMHACNLNCYGHLLFDSSPLSKHRGLDCTNVEKTHSLNICKRLIWEANMSCPNLPSVLEGNIFDGQCENTSEWRRVISSITSANFPFTADRF